MTTPSIKFKKLLFTHEKDARRQILNNLCDWLKEQSTVDSEAKSCYNSIQTIYAANNWTDTPVFDSLKEFKNHSIWSTMSNHDSCISFQELVKSKLEIPKKNMAIAVKEKNTEPRKTIPKKIRGEAWKIQFGDSTKGSCFCCKKELDIFDVWHAGHVVSHSNGGTDTANNLRPVCGSCNYSMGTENMDDFKQRCYPEPAVQVPVVQEIVKKEEEAVFWYPGILFRESPRYIKWKPGTNSLQMGAELERNKYKYDKEKGVYVRNF